MVMGESTRGVVIGCEVMVQARRRRRFGQAGHGRFPFGREFEAHFGGTRMASDQGQERGGAVEESEGILHPVGADGHFAAIDAVRNVDGRCAGRFHAPAVLSRLDEGQWFAAGIGDGEGFDVAGEFADEVRSGGPNRHEEFNRGLTCDRHDGFDGDVVSLGRGEAESVPNRYVEHNRSGGNGAAWWFSTIRVGFMIAKSLKESNA